MDEHAPSVMVGRGDGGQASTREMASMQCCCGSLECVFLRHNCSVLDNVEKDVHDAARIGQALLVRHEAYMADAERDRMELTGRIEKLETDNRELEAKNAKTIEENRNLLDQLESLNTIVADSEGRVRSLEATLLSSQQIIRRLEGETARAESLERQLAYLEQEQADLQSTLITSQEEARSAMFRWKRAERGINDLQDQLERMETEARQERERHAEMMGRMEKQREVEKELSTAAGRLKGAAASKSLNRANTGSNVVSHFVRDILQDNAHLQQGISELREMLMNSNDEIQALREQLLYHQPLGDGDTNGTETLMAELESKLSPKQNTPAISQELHIHHHYHVSKPEAKKPKKKRQGLTAGIFIPPAQASLPSTPPNGQWHPQGITRTKRDSIPSNRWSVLSEQPSEFAPSSVPSSPQSNHRNSLFDPASLESYPGSPTTSVDPMSPTWRASHRKQASYNMSSRGFQVASMTPTQAQPIMEESDGTEDGQDVPDLVTGSDESDESMSKDSSAAQDEVDIYLEDTVHDLVSRRRLRRTQSHESIISLAGGLDIHTLKSRPSQLTLRPLSDATSITASSTVTARPVLARGSAKRSSAMLRDTYGASPVGSVRSGSTASPSGLGISKWVGWRPWGGLTASASTTTTAKPNDKDLQKNSSRPPGINQPGAIPGFHEYYSARQRKLPSKVLPDILDVDALREGLAE